MILIFLFILLSSASARESNVTDPFSKRVVYGTDNRVEISELEPRYRTLSSAVAGIFWKTDVLRQIDGKYLLSQRSYSCPNSRPWCSREKYTDQKIGPWCSSFLIGPKLVASAGHCVEDIERIRFVFGYTNSSNMALPEDVYDCSKIVVKVNTRTDDYAIFELDREVNRRPISISSSEPTIGEGLVMIGFPMGLPMKADFGRIRGITDKLLAADLDAFAGNSGSLVASNETLSVIGILIAGNSDFSLDESGCCKARICSSTWGCIGTWERCTRASMLLSFIT